MMKADGAAQGISLGEAALTWMKIAALSFGGPAGQSAGGPVRVDGRNRISLHRRRSRCSIGHGQRRGRTAMAGAFSIRAMPVGAEIIGLKGDAFDAETQAALYQAWLDHGILLFRDVDSIDRHLALSRCFGELEIHPYPDARWSEDPLFIDIGGRRRRAYVYDNGDIRVNRIPWHRDTAYTPDICKGAMLRMIAVPESDGETMFADTAAAYDDLPADLKARLENLEYKATLRLSHFDQSRPGALWTSVRNATDAEDPGAGPGAVPDANVEDRYPPVVHPAVLTHPESGRRCIFLSPTYVDHFIGMEKNESDDLLNALVAHMLQPRYIHKHRWSVNEAIVWDNRRFMHAGVGNSPGQTRRGLRTTLAGPLRTGRYFDPGVQEAGTAALAD
jgi:taurine dioxygenase